MQQQLSEVSNVLWRERQLLELLIFKLEEEQLVLASGRARWLTQATREVETVLAEIKRLELERAVVVAQVGGMLGMGDSPSLRDLAEQAPDPWQGIFDEHRRALLDLAQEIDGVAQANRDLLARGQQATREALAAVGEFEMSAYSPTGSAPNLKPASLRVVDEAM